MIDIIASLSFSVILAIPFWFLGQKMGKYEEHAKIAHGCCRNYNVWIHREEMDFKDEKGVVHWHGMCPKCGLLHDFLDGHSSQYQYCPQCGLHLGE